MTSKALKQRAGAVGVGGQAEGDGGGPGRGREGEGADLGRVCGRCDMAEPRRRGVGAA